MNVSILKNILRSEISLYNDKKKQFDDELYLKDLLEELNTLTNVDSINELHSNMLGISIILPLIYGEEEAKLLENKLYNLIFRLINLYGKKEFQNDYIKEEKNLRSVINKFFQDYVISQSKLAIYGKELHAKQESQKWCRKILYRFNHNYLISDDLIHNVKAILQERGYFQEQIIVASELINHHNQRVRFNQPKISYTTIKIVESDFTLFELAEMQNRESKSKLDSWSYTTFEALIEEEICEKAYDFLDEMTSWMSGVELEYALKSVLNKFIEELQNCKKDMLEGNNYEDQELRKFIVDEYNNYYYKFKNIEKYYYEKTKKEVLEEPSDLKIGGY